MIADYLLLLAVSTDDANMFHVLEFTVLTCGKLVQGHSYNTESFSSIALASEQKM